MAARLIRYAIIAVLLGSALAASAEDKPVTLKMTFKKGDTLRNKAETTVDANGMEVKVEQTTKITVKEIKDNGQVVIERLNEGGVVHFGGQDQQIPASPAETLTRDKSGKLLEFKAGEGGMSIYTAEITKLLLLVDLPVFQDKEVKAGDSWETEYDNPAAKDKKFKVKTTFVGTEKVDGTDLWKIKQVSEPATDAAGAKMGYEVTYWLDPSTGQDVKSEVSVKDVPTQFGAMSMKIKVGRVKEAAK